MDSARVSAGTSSATAATSLPEVFSRITSALDQAGIAYMLSGSFASAYYGAPRSTQDIDIVMGETQQQVQFFVEGLSSDQRRPSMFNVIDLAADWKINLIIRKSQGFSREEFGRRQLTSLRALLFS